MGWERIKHPHVCSPPDELPIFRRVRDGDRWRCRCGRLWELSILRWGSRYQMRWHFVDETGE